MKTIVAVLLKDGKMMYLKNGSATPNCEEATLFENWNEAKTAMNEHSLYQTRYPLAWFILVQGENEEWASQTTPAC